MNRLSVLSLMLILLLSLFSCEEPIIPVSAIILNSETLSMTEGDEFRLTATVSPTNATDKSLVWSSSNASIASVNDGVVTAVSPGSATITATSLNGGAKATCTVTVSARWIDVQSITLNKVETTLVVGESLSLTATVKPDNASDKTVSWRSSDATVASVDNSGKVTALKGGTAIITAKAGEKEASCNITVIVPVSSLSLDQVSITLTEGQTITLTATVTPSDASDKTVTWSSANPDVATVDQSGNVTALAEGETTVTATAGSVSASCTVTVEKKVIAVTSITLNKTSLKLPKGDTETLIATISPDDATDKTVIWSSSDSNIATVDQNGVITAVNDGNATITAKAGEQEAACSVIVESILEPINPGDGHDW